MNTSTRRLVESAIMIAIGTVLSMFSFSGPWALGGGITICSMLPMVILAHRYGTRWGLFSSFVYAMLQMALGFKNVQYGPNLMIMVLIAVIDYVLAFGVLGLSAIFNKMIKNRLVAIIAGTCFAFFLRYACHFTSGCLIWEALWPNSLGWATPIWSLAYNGSYMIPEMLITSAVIALSYKPLETYWLAKDLPQQTR